MLVVATSGTGFVLGSGSAIDFSALCWTCAGTMMVAASANSLNQVCSCYCSSFFFLHTFVHKIYVTCILWQVFSLSNRLSDLLVYFCSVLVV